MWQDVFIVCYKQYENLESINSFKSWIYRIDWDRKAEPFARNLVGNENKSGVIGMDMPSLERQKWMWHLWGTGVEELTVVGFHRETSTIHLLLINGNEWTTELGGENYGAYQHIPSSVKIPERGEWAILLYVDGELFDILVYEIRE
ncbi:hypothetical protein ACQCT5_03195 [Sutcliffiella halmapala]